jgi:hypothetical protein
MWWVCQAAAAPPAAAGGAQSPRQGCPQLLLQQQRRHTRAQVSVQQVPSIKAEALLARLLHAQLKASCLDKIATAHTMAASAALL